MGKRQVRQRNAGDVAARVFWARLGIAPLGTGRGWGIATRIRVAALRGIGRGGRRRVVLWAGPLWRRSARRLRARLIGGSPPILSLLSILSGLSVAPAVFAPIAGCRVGLGWVTRRIVGVARRWRLIWVVP